MLTCLINCKKIVYLKIFQNLQFFPVLCVTSDLFVCNLEEIELEGNYPSWILTHRKGLSSSSELIFHVLNHIKASSKLCEIVLLIANTSQAEIEASFLILSLSLADIFGLISATKGMQDDKL